MTSSAVQMGVAHGKMQQAPDKQPMNAVDVSEAAAADAPLKAQQITHVAHQNADMTMTLAYTSNGAKSAAPMLASGQPEMHVEPQSVAPALLMTGNGGKVVQPVLGLHVSPEAPPLESNSKSMHPDPMQASLAAPGDIIADSSAMQQSEARELVAAPEQPRLSAEQVLALAKASVYKHGLSCVHCVQQWDQVYRSYGWHAT